MTKGHPCRLATQTRLNMEYFERARPAGSMPRSCRLVLDEGTALVRDPRRPRTAGIVLRIATRHKVNFVFIHLNQN